jgi:hypothetical protein
MGTLLVRIITPLSVGVIHRLVELCCQLRVAAERGKPRRGKCIVYTTTLKCVFDVVSTIAEVNSLGQCVRMEDIRLGNEEFEGV